MATKLIGLATILLSVANDDFVFLDKKYVILIPFFLGHSIQEYTLPEVSVVRLYCDD